MRPKTSSAGKITGRRRLWIVPVALFFLVGTACTDQPEATDQGVSSPLAAESDTEASPPWLQKQARNPLRALAESTERAGDESREQRQQRIAKLREDRYAKLGLSDEQKQSIEALRVEQKAWRTEHRDEVRALATKRKAARQAGDEVEAEEIRLQVRELRETLPTERDIMAVLTDEQRAQLRENRPISVQGQPPRRRASPARAADAAPAPL